MTLFPGLPGWAGARRVLLDFVVQGKINRGRHRPSSWVPLHPDQPVPTSTIPPIFYRPDAFPATQPTVSKHWRTSTFGKYDTITQNNPKKLSLTQINCNTQYNHRKAKSNQQTTVRSVFSFFSTMLRDWLGRMFPKWPILCGVEWDVKP